MKTNPFGHFQVLIDKKLDTMSVGEELPDTDILSHLCEYRLLSRGIRGGDCQTHILNEAERSHRAGMHAEAADHPLLGGEGQLSLPEFVLKSVDVQILVALEGDEIMPVALVIAHEEVLAMRRGQVFPILESLFNGRKRRVAVQLKVNAVGLEKIRDPGDAHGYFRVIEVLLKTLTIHYYLFHDTFYDNDLA